ncbi:MAG TPA: hypothetical protein O0X37_05000, partial [Methanocorpusculum sp.]|nr:hypothetical protein [Methanocorpusculum sp.]
VLDEPSNMFLGYNGALRNVTDRRNAEQGVKRWKLFLDGVMDNIPGIIIVTDMKQMLPFTPILQQNSFST